MPAYGQECPSPCVTVENRAEARYTDYGGYPLLALSEVVQTPVSGLPVLTIHQTPSSDPVPPGRELTYDITVVNTGNVEATDVTVDDVLPAGTVFIGAADGGVESLGLVIWPGVDLLPGESFSTSVTVRVSPDTADGSELPNVVRAVSAEGATADSTVTPLVGSSGALSVSISADRDVVVPGQPITYTIDVKNTGPVVLNALHVFAPVPNLTAFTSASDGGSRSGSLVSWTGASLLPGETVSFTYTVAVGLLAPEGTVLSAVASASSARVALQVSDPADVLVIENRTIVLTPDPDTIVANGTDVSLLTARVTYDDGDPLPDGTPVTFVTDKGVFDNGAQTIGGVISGGNGVAKTHLTAPILTKLDVANVQAFIGPAASNRVLLTVLPGAAGIQVYDVTNGRFITASDARYLVEVVITYTDPDGIEQTRRVSVDQNGLYLIPSVQTGGEGYRIYTIVTDRITGAEVVATPPQTVVITPAGVTVPPKNSIHGTLRERDDAAGVHAGVTIYLYDAQGNPVATTTTDSNGRYAFHDVEPGAYYIYAELPEGRRVARSTPQVNEESGVVLVDADLLVDPYGIVYDSVTGEPLAGVTVEIQNPDGTPAVLPDPDLVPGAVDTNPQITGPNGGYQWPLIKPGTYKLAVIPAADSGYVFPSQNPQPYYPLNTGSKGGLFEVVLEVVNINIPLDPPTGELSVEKTASKNRASVGDMILYSVKVTARGGAIPEGVRIVDVMPHGFQYMKGSSRIDDEAFSDPEGAGRRTLSWMVPMVLSNESVTLTYRVLLGVGSQTGKRKNSAYVQSLSDWRPVTSRTASHVLEVVDGVFSDRGNLIGKVYVEECPDGIQACGETERRPVEGEGPSSGTSTGEQGIPGVAIYMEDGTRVMTDRNGKYSIPGIEAGTHVLRLDGTTLPPGLTAVPTSSRFMGSRDSQFADIPPGGLFKANFAVKRRANPEGASEMISPIPVGPTAVGERAPGSTRQSPKPPDLEDRIGPMTSDLGILSPQADDVIPGDHTDIQIKAALDAETTLWVNDREIGPERIGRTVTHRKRRVAIYEFISVPLKPGATNRIRARVKDPFGNIRGEEEITVTTIGAPSRITIEPEQTEMPADGLSRVRVSVAVLDQNGHAVPYIDHVTVSASAGEITEDDADRATMGHQVAAENGVASFSLRAPRDVGNSEIRAFCNGQTESVEIFFAPHLRNLMIVGVGELNVGYGNSRGDVTPLRDREDFDDGFYAGSRGAVFVKGKVLDDVLLTAAYDSEKDREEELFRTRDTDLESETQYPIYGDESRIGYEAQSSEKLYVKLEKERSYLLFGDYRTGLSDSRLSAYGRSFNGLKYDLDTDRLKVRAFGSYTDQTQVVDTIPGKGIAGYYFLSRRSLLDGSERVVIETRDRYVIDRVIARETKTRWTDYEVDYGTGAILFREPVPSHDERSNPVFVVVTYESRDKGRKYYSYGGRGAVTLTEGLTVGFTGITEQEETGDYELYGLDMTLNLPGDTTMTAEFARTESPFDLNSRISLKSDSGWSVDLESRPSDSLQVIGYHRDIGEYFHNMSAVDAMRGSRNYGGEVVYRFSPDFAVRARIHDERDDLNHTQDRHMSLSAEKAFHGIRTEIGILRETSTDNYVLPRSPTSRYPLDKREERVDDVTAIRAGVDYPLGDDLSLTASHKQDVSHNQYQLSRAGLSYRFSDTTSAHIREEYARYREREEMRTTLGVESEIAENTVLYDEYRLDNGATGGRNQQVIGLRNRFVLGEGVTGNLAAEHLTTITGDKRQGEPDGFAVSGGLAYLAKDKLKLTSRLEYRSENSETPYDSYLASLGIAYALNPDYSLLLKERYYMDDHGIRGDRVTNRTVVGLAYRPTDCDRINLIGKMAYVLEKDTQSGPGFQTESFIPSVEAIYQYSSRLQLMGKYAGKWMGDGAFHTYTDMVSARILYDVSDNIDLGVLYRVMTSHETGSTHQGGEVEVGYRFFRDFWVSLGYSFDDFDADLSADDYRGYGPFLKLRFKFDERTFSTRKHGGRIEHRESKDPAP